MGQSVSFRFPFKPKRVATTKRETPTSCPSSLEGTRVGHQKEKKGNQKKEPFAFFDFSVVLVLEGIQQETLPGTKPRDCSTRSPGAGRSRTPSPPRSPGPSPRRGVMPLAASEQGA